MFGVEKCSQGFIILKYTEHSIEVTMAVREQNFIVRVRDKLLYNKRNLT